jgi:hypothetical protein
MLQEVTSLLRHQSRVWIDFVGVVSTWLILFSAALAFLTNVSEKHKSVPSSASQMKNRRNTIGIIKKLV